ncbi:zinc dependent phospholipase C family protein [Halobacillus yeomjeoni]|uniref:zinc dependent phospholipase C family protein n=1 Tax=Halobacillus yeomjeoni TaxID=311194 RepID=UPI001CD4EA6E|nr:zinc dependent phospholipase C family protein [Halobacillus yeomjeoni]MCA0983912.1 zinc dependent phospholipase C family protein [Halobacillus yeomjeoni]
MPNIWTHILFVDELCTRLNRYDLIKTAGPCLHMGAQGPDPFFYHDFWPFKAGKNVEDVGMRLHTEKCGLVLLDMIERGASEKNKLQAFILGFVSHHILDRHTHPYIHFHSGYEENKHQKLEVLIDTLMLARYMKKQTWKSPVHKQIKLGGNRKLISGFMMTVLDQHFPEMMTSYPPGFIEQSYKDMEMAQRILYDPYGWKNKWFGEMVSSFSHQPVKGTADYLNIQRNAWKHSATNEERFESFLDLYETALQEGEQLFHLILGYWKDLDQKTFMDIESVVSDISYDTGMPLAEGWQNKWSEPIV